MRSSSRLSGESESLPATPEIFSAGSSVRAWARGFGAGTFT